MKHLHWPDLGWWMVAIHSNATGARPVCTRLSHDPGPATQVPTLLCPNTHSELSHSPSQCQGPQQTLVTQSLSHANSVPSLSCTWTGPSGLPESSSVPRRWSEAS